MPALRKTSKGPDAQILFGVHAVEEAIRAGRRKVYEIYFSKGSPPKRFRGIVLSAQSRGIPIRWLDAADFSAMLGDARHQGIGARVSGYPWIDTACLFDRCRRKAPPAFFLMLDSVVDPQNLGALIRTAACVGVDGIWIPKDRSAGPTPGVARASAGALEHVAMAQITNVAKTLSQLKAAGCWIVGLGAAEGGSVFSADLTVPVCIVIGGEQRGIRPLVRKQCDLLVSIPQTGVIDSLNASAAGAVALYEVYRQRIPGDRGR